MSSARLLLASSPGVADELLKSVYCRMVERAGAKRRGGGYGAYVVHDRSKSPDAEPIFAWNLDRS